MQGTGTGSVRGTCRCELDTSNIAAVYFNTTFAGIETADAILIVGSHVRWEAPLVNVRLRKAVKNLTDANAEFLKGGRADLVAANETEIKVLQKYLPAGLDEAKIEALIAEAIAATGAVSKKEMGKVIAALKAHPDAGQIDFGAASKRVQAKLA